MAPSPPQVMRFQWIAPNIQTGFHRGDAISTIRPTGTLRSRIPTIFLDSRRICDPRPEQRPKKLKEREPKANSASTRCRQDKGRPYAAKTIEVRQREKV